MKCQKCGKNEVNFYYSSNVNGQITKAEMCSECAEESGYETLLQSELESMHDIFAGFMPMMPRLQTNVFFPVARSPFRELLNKHPRPERRLYSCGCGCDANTNVGNTATAGDCDNNMKKTAIDESISKRRELNRQMRIAVKNEEFERAAVLRDEIRAMEQNA